MLADYRWVAMLDPVELAEGFGRGLPIPSRAPSRSMRCGRSITTAGRPGRRWCVPPRRTIPAAPAAPCCSRQSQAREAAAGEPGVVGEPSGYHYADAHRVTLDVGTGVCVRSEGVGGTRSGWSHEVAVEAVDEPMGDALFSERRPGLMQRLRH